MTAKNFFTITAVFELLTAVALLIAPALTTYMLIGSSLDTLPAVMVGRVAGAALFTIAIACWNARTEANSGTASGIIKALLFYNLLVILLLSYGAFTSSMMGVGFFPAIITHALLAVWCAACLLRTPITHADRIDG